MKDLENAFRIERVIRPGDSQEKHVNLRGSRGEPPVAMRKERRGNCAERANVDNRAKWNIVLFSMNRMSGSTAGRQLGMGRVFSAIK